MQASTPSVHELEETVFVWSLSTMQKYALRHLHHSYELGKEVCTLDGRAVPPPSTSVSLFVPFLRAPSGTHKGRKVKMFAHYMGDTEARVAPAHKNIGTVLLAPFRQAPSGTHKGRKVKRVSY